GAETAVLDDRPFLFQRGGSEEPVRPAGGDTLAGRPGRSDPRVRPSLLPEERDVVFRAAVLEHRLGPGEETRYIVDVLPARRPRIPGLGVSDGVVVVRAERRESGPFGTRRGAVGEAVHDGLVHAAGEGRADDVEHVVGRRAGPRGVVPLTENCPSFAREDLLASHVPATRDDAIVVGVLRPERFSLGDVEDTRLFN